MSGSSLRLTVLGSRGSMPAGGASYSEYGSSTSCYLVQVGQYSVFLDAGSGLIRAPSSFAEPPTILLSHWHLDHVLGIGMFPWLSRPNTETNVYVPAASDEEGKQRLDALYAPPFWPLRLDDYPSKLNVRAMPQTLSVGPMRVTTTEGNHPGGCLVFRIDCDGKSIVYATDYEHEPSSFARLREFCRDADLLMYDAQYVDEEYDTHRGYGHSTPRKGIALMHSSGTKQLLLIHHDPRTTDEVLRQRELPLVYSNVRFAREGEVFEL